MSATSLGPLCDRDSVKESGYTVRKQGSVFSAVCDTFSFCLSLKYLGNRWTDLRQIYREDVLGPSLGRVGISR